MPVRPTVSTYHHFAHQRSLPPRFPLGHLVFVLLELIISTKNVIFLLCQVHTLFFYSGVRITDLLATLCADWMLDPLSVNDGDDEFVFLLHPAFLNYWFPWCQELRELAPIALQCLSIFLVLIS